MALLYKGAKLNVRAPLFWCSRIQEIYTMNAETEKRINRFLIRLQNMPVSLLKEVLIADQEENNLGAHFEITRDDTLMRALESVGAKIENGCVDVTTLQNKLH